jgi:hypothetical protein
MRPASVLPEVRDRDPHEVDGAEGVGLEHGAHRLVRRRLEDVEETDAGDVEDGIHLAEVRHRGVERRSDRCRIRHVERVHQQPVRRGSLPIVGVAQGGDDVPAGVVEFLGGRFAEAGRAARDENCSGHVTTSLGITDSALPNPISKYHR